MFILNNKPLSPDRAFTTEDGTQYPANWLRLSSPEERAALGITETEDEPWYDQRFYWGVGNPKDHAQLVEQWTSQIKQTAGSLLAQTDWYITRASETGLAAPQSVIDRRSYIRYLSNERKPSWPLQRPLTSLLLMSLVLSLITGKNPHLLLMTPLLWTVLPAAL